MQKQKITRPYTWPHRRDESPVPPHTLGHAMHTRHTAHAPCPHATQPCPRVPSRIPIPTEFREYQRQMGVRAAVGASGPQFYMCQMHNTHSGTTRPPFTAMFVRLMEVLSHAATSDGSTEALQSTAWRCHIILESTPPRCERRGRGRCRGSRRGARRALPPRRPCRR